LVAEIICTKIISISVNFNSFPQFLFYFIDFIFCFIFYFIFSSYLFCCYLVILICFQVLFTIISFVLNVRPRDQEKSCVHFYKTNSYKLHYLETPTSLKFVLLSDPDTPDLRDTLRQIYRNVFVEYVIKNPLYKIGDPIKCELFSQNLQKEIKQIASAKK
jgi:hypothetical protein